MSREERNRVAASASGAEQHVPALQARQGLPSSMGPDRLLEATPECVVMAALDRHIVFVNRRLEELSGFSREEVVGRPIETLLPGGVRAPAARDGDGRQALVGECLSKAGEAVPVELHVGVVEADGEDFILVTLRDIRELVEGREARFEAEAKYRALVERIPAITYIDEVDENGRSIYVSPQVTELLGVSTEEWLEDPYSWRRHVHADDIDRAWDEYVHAYNNLETLTHEYRMVHEDGSVLWVSEQASIIRNEAGEPWLIQGVIFDITERKRAEEEVAFLAYHDKLTGLPNRAMFEEFVEIALARAGRHDLGVGVLFLDLDNFKLVNDSLGHHAGDELLVQLAERLRGCTRETDLVARQGGDEFLMLLSDLERGTGTMPGTDAAVLVAESVASRVREALEEPFALSGTEFYASASIGISLFPQDAPDADALLRNSDSAMYQSKRTSPGTFNIFTQEHDDRSDKLSLTTRLRRAVENQNWILHYQPVVRLVDQSIEGVEALLRWHDPNGGIVPPGEFIPLAEEMGLIGAIGDWVIEELARQQRQWREEGLDLEVSFNLSPRQLWQVSLAETMIGQLSAFDVDPRKIVVEITESTAMTDPERTQRLLAELHAWGLRLAIDDFGTGYSSLSRLRHLPVDVLKIDRTFVRDVDRDPDAASMVRAMIQLALSLGMTPLAEGIETDGELRFLIGNDCPLGQGFHLARPMPADELSRLWWAGSGRAIPASRGAGLASA
jgi:diguanylate cyclase (GGDEF)-like protein/PAS domain S-box-containing protein